MAYFFMLMRGIIVNDNMQVFILVSLSFNRLEEFEKLFMCMLLVTLTGDTTSSNIKRRKKRTGAVSFIIMRDSPTTSFL